MSGFHLYLVVVSLLIISVCSQRYCDSPLWKEQIANVASGSQAAVDYDDLTFFGADRICADDCETVVSGSSYEPVDPIVRLSGSETCINHLRSLIDTERSRSIWNYAGVVWYLPQTDWEILERRVVLLAAVSSLLSNTISTFRWIRKSSSRFIKLIEHKVQLMEDSALWIMKYVKQYFLLMVGTALGIVSFDLARVHRDRTSTSTTIKPFERHSYDQHVTTDGIEKPIKDSIESGSSLLHTRGRETVIEEHCANENSLYDLQKAAHKQSTESWSPTQPNTGCAWAKDSKFRMSESKYTSDKLQMSSPKFTSSTDPVRITTTTSDIHYDDHNNGDLKAISPLPIPDDESRVMLDVDKPFLENVSRVSLTEDSSTTNQDLTPHVYSPATPNSSEQGFIVDFSSKKRSMKEKINSDCHKPITKRYTTEIDGYSTREPLFDSSRSDVIQTTDDSQCSSSTSVEAVRSSPLLLQRHNHSKGSSLRVTKHKILGHSVIVPQNYGHRDRSEYTNEPSPTSEMTSLSAKGWIESGKPD